MNTIRCFIFFLDFMIQQTNKIYINLMAQFYKKYHRLFTDYEDLAYQKNKKIKPYYPFNLQNNYRSHQPNPLPINKTPYNIIQPSNQPINYSPALNEFEIKVLPHIKSLKQSDDDLYKLRQQMRNNSIRLKKLFNESNQKSNQFYQLPKINKHQRTYTQPNNNDNNKNINYQYNGEKQNKFIKQEQNKKGKNNYMDQKKRQYELLNNNIEQLERQYMKNSRGRRVKNNADKRVQKVSDQAAVHQNDNINKSQIIHTNNDNFSPNQQQIKRNPISKQQNLKKWQIKILPFHERTKTLKQSPKLLTKHNDTISFNRQLQQLYGINTNPYAFANSKLADLKKIQKISPFGYINTYTQCLLRRKQNKIKISQRRNKLKCLLEEQYESYSRIK